MPFTSTFSNSMTEVKYAGLADLAGLSNLKHLYLPDFLQGRLTKEAVD